MMNRVYTEEEKKPNIVSDKMCIKLLHIIFFCFFVFFPQMKFFKKLLYVLTFKKNILHQLDIIYFPMCINTLIWQYISLILEGPHQNATQNHPNDQEFFILCLPFSWNDFKKEHVHTFLYYYYFFKIFTRSQPLIFCLTWKLFPVKEKSFTFKDEAYFNTQIIMNYWSYYHTHRKIGQNFR